MIAVIAGATGLVGSHLVEKLLADKDFEQVISVGRKMLPLEHQRLKQVMIGELNQLSERQLELKGTHYFCCLGTTIKAAGSREQFTKVDYNGVLNFGKVALFHRAQAFVLISAVGANPQSNIFYNRVKGEGENALRELGLEHLLIFRPALLSGERKSFRLVEKIALSILSMISPLMSAGLKKRILTEAGLLASQMILRGKNPQQKLSIIEAKYI